MSTIGSRADRLSAIRQQLGNQITPEGKLLLQQIESLVRTLDAAGGEPRVTTVINAQGHARLNFAFGTHLAQLTPERAREIAWMLIDAAAVAEAEAGFVRFMTERVRFDQTQIGEMLQDVRHYRQQRQRAQGEVRSETQSDAAAGAPHPGSQPGAAQPTGGREPG